MHQQNRLEKFLLNSSPPSLWSWTQVWIPGVLATQLPLIQVRPSQRRVNLPFSVWLQPPEIEPLFLLCCFLHCVFHECVCLSVCYPEVQLFHTLQTLVGRSLKAQVAANLLERNVSLQILIAKGCGRAQWLSWRILCDLLDCSPLGSSIRGSFRQEYWNESLFPPPWIFLTQGSNPRLLCLLHCRQIICQWATREASKGCGHPVVIFSSSLSLSFPSSLSLLLFLALSFFPSLLPLRECFRATFQANFDYAIQYYWLEWPGWA